LTHLVFACSIRPVWAATRSRYPSFDCSELVAAVLPGNCLVASAGVWAAYCLVAYLFLHLASCIVLHLGVGEADWVEVAYGRVHLYSMWISSHGRKRFHGSFNVFNNFPCTNWIELGRTSSPRAIGVELVQERGSDWG
jgi:hypothetical protein